MEQTNPTPTDTTSVIADPPVMQQSPNQTLSGTDSSVITDQKSSGSSNKMLFIGIVIVLILAIGVGMYWLMSTSIPSSSQDAQSSSQQTTEALNSLKQELGTLNIEDTSIQEDLTELDKDLANL